jgi:tRNA A-37 threonylcarbamoyl transferase component Bud32
MMCKAKGSAAPTRRVRVAEDRYRETLDIFLQSPQKFIEEGRVFKPGSRGFAVMAEIGGRACFIKHYRPLGWVYRVRNIFRASRAADTFKTMQHLRTRGVPAPAPFFYLEERRFLTLGDAYLVIEFVDKCVDLQQFWEKCDATGRWAALQLCAEILGKMHAAGCCHGDLKWNNLLVKEENGTLQVVLVDLDAASCFRPFSLLRRKADLRRFLRDLAAVDGAADYQDRFVAEWKQWTEAP